MAVSREKRKAFDRTENRNTYYRATEKCVGGLAVYRVVGACACVFRVLETDVFNGPDETKRRLKKRRFSRVVQERTPCQLRPNVADVHVLWGDDIINRRTARHGGTIEPAK